MQDVPDAPLPPPAASDVGLSTPDLPDIGDLHDPYDL
jgi:hypothetical protein